MQFFNSIADYNTVIFHFMFSFSHLENLQLLQTIILEVFINIIWVLSVLLQC